MTYLFVIEKPSTELHTNCVATHDIGNFQNLLNTETEDGKYKILAELLSYEFDAFRPYGPPKG